VQAYGTEAEADAEMRLRLMLGWSWRLRPPLGEGGPATGPQEASPVRGRSLPGLGSTGGSW
jgi:hypothetical protein